MLETVAGSCKSDSLPEVSKMSGKGNVAANGVVKFATGATFTNFGFKDGKTATLDSNALLKADKGSAAASKVAPKSAKPTVKGGLKPKKKSITKQNIAGLASKIAKFTPGGKEAVKKSTARLGPKAIATPSDGASSGKTTEVKSMRDFKKLVAFHKAQKKNSKK